jgi:hypothetical protein
MDKLLAKELLILVNHNNDLLEKYAMSRISTLHKQLENTKEIEAIYKIQGQIAEIRKLLTLREEVIQKAEGN